MTTHSKRSYPQDSRRSDYMHEEKGDSKQTRSPPEQQQQSEVSPYIMDRVVLPR